MRLASLLGTALGGLLAALVPGLAAADAALVLANEGYSALPPLPDGDAPARATDGIEALGFDVASLADGGREDAGRALARFMAGVPEAERLLVVLSGRFATDGTRSWFLTADSPVPTLFGLNSNAVSLESVLAVLARRPSRAVLVLGVEPDAQGPFDPWLSEGLGELDVPQGVTVLGSTPRAVAAFLADELSEPGGDLAALVTANPAIRSDGYLPQGFAFMPEAPEAPQAPPRPRAPEGPSAAERALWEGAVALDTVEAFRDYLRRYPQGSYAPEARAAVAAILAEPNRAARLEEEALRLGRDERRQVQADLAALDFDPRGLDGVFGPGTRAAITNWQQENGFPQTSYLDAEQLGRLAEQVAEREALEEAQRRVAARADDEFWERTGADGDVEGLRAYLARYPDGRHAEEAADRVALLEAAVREEAERGAWERAREAGTVEAFDRYLQAWPEGRHAPEAREARRAARAEAEAEARRAVAREGEAALGLTPLTARVIEARLRALGFDPGEVDGEIGRDTRDAIRGYQDERGLAATGYLDEGTLVRLLADTLGQRLDD